MNDIRSYKYNIKKAQYEAGAKMFIDRIFSNLEVKLSKKYPAYIFYKLNNEVVAIYNKENYYFYYHYIKIYNVLELEFGFYEDKIDDLIFDKVKEYLKFDEVIPNKSGFTLDDIKNLINGD